MRNNHFYHCIMRSIIPKNCNLRKVHIIFHYCKMQKVKKAVPVLCVTIVKETCNLYFAQHFFRKAVFCVIFLYRILRNKIKSLLYFVKTVKCVIICKYFVLSEIVYILFLYFAEKNLPML